MFLFQTYPFTENTHYMNFSHAKIWEKNVYKLSYVRNFNFFNDLGGGVLRWTKDGFCDDMNNIEA